MNNYKTVKDFAAEIKVSNQTIYNRLNELDKRKYTKRVKGTIYISQQGQEIIRNKIYKIKEIKPEEKETDLKELEAELKKYQDLISLKDSLIIDKDLIIKSKDETISKYNETILKQAALIIKQQEELKESKEKIGLLDPKNKSFFEKIKDLFK